MAHPRFPEKHHDGYDSGSDEEDHDNDHHHDTHDKHHHHHVDATTDVGERLSLNEYHHDPKHGTEAYHLHTVPLNIKGRTEMRSVYHYGSDEHKDEPRGSALYWLNRYPVTKKFKPTPIVVESAATTAEVDDDQPGYKKPLIDHDHCIKPSAPPADSRVSNHHAGFYSSMKTDHVDSNEVTQESCCGCTIL